MKTRKSIFSAILISLLVLAMLPTSAFAEPVTSITVDTSSSVSGSVYWCGGTANAVFSQGGVQTFEAEYVLNSTDSTAYLGTKGSSPWYPVRYCANENSTLGKEPRFLIDATGTGDGTASKMGTATVGEKYHILAVMNVLSSSSKADIYINGVKVASNVNCEVTSEAESTTSSTWWRRINLNKDGAIKAVLTKTSAATIADYDVSGYMASVIAASDAEGITITGDKTTDDGSYPYSNLGISLGTLAEKITVDDLLAKLTVSTGAAAKMYDGDTECVATDYVEDGYVLKVTSSNGAVVNEYEIDLTYSWPAGALVWDNSANDKWSRTTLNPYPTQGDMVVIDYNCVAPATSASDWAPARLTNSDTSKYWNPIMFSGGSIIGNVISDTNSKHNERINLGSYKEGETYHIVSVLRLDDNSGSETKTEARLFINGAEVIPQGKVRVHYSDTYEKFGAQAGIKATITMYKNTTSVAEFDYSEYAAKAIPDADSGIYVTGDSYNNTVFKNFGITIAKKEAITVGDFLKAIDIAGTAALYASGSATEAMAESNTVATGNVLKITSANGEVVNSYAVTVTDTASVDVITLTDGTASVKASSSANKLFIAAYKTENGATTLQEVKQGSIIGDTLTASLTETDGMTIKAFYWTDALVPIDAE